MTWTIIRTIWFRELRDLCRDRRTLLMIVVLPTVLYPIMGFIGYEFALRSKEAITVVGIHGVEHLPPRTPRSGYFSAVPAASILSLTPGGGIDRFAGTMALSETSWRRQDYPPLLIDGRFPIIYCGSKHEAEVVRVEALPSADLAPLESKQVDVLLVVPADFQAQLDAGKRPKLDLFTRRGDETSRLAERRLRGILNTWKRALNTSRFVRRGLPPDFDSPFAEVWPQRDAQPLKHTADDIGDMLASFFPFMLIMWSMAGALYPAIDVCAGEKERGTLETLLLSPATRLEIVGGKFLAVWVFSAGTALWNLTWMGGGTWVAHAWLEFPVLRLGGLVWCVLLTLLLSALFSAISLALGVYARSTKEGQYYLLPLFLVTLPLTFLPLLPGVELNVFYSLVPVTGATLLLQRLMMDLPGQTPWRYFPPVLLSLVLSIALALRWAVAQFQREEVLFREAGRLSLGASLRRLFVRERSAEVEVPATNLDTDTARLPGAP